MRRVSHHQSVFDLLNLQPGESAQARRMIEAHERRQGRRLPEAVRQWYLIDGVVGLRDLPTWPHQAEAGHLWHDYSNEDHPESLETVLRQFAHEVGEQPSWGLDRVRVLVENQGVCSWFVRPDGSDDPPVLVDEFYDYEKSQLVHWVRVADHFSEFVFAWIAESYSRNWTPLSARSGQPGQPPRQPPDKPHLDGLWLYAPAAQALAPPYLDYLIENLDEETRAEVADGVTQYRFRDEHGSLRVTSDDCREEGGVSAWWLHGRSEEGLLRLARKAWWCCDLPVTLKSGTKVGKAVLERVREGG